MMRSVLAVVLALGLGSGAGAQDTAPALADAGLQARIDGLSAQTDGFERGLLMSLRAVEKTLQTRYTYGMGDRMNGLPLLRLDVGARNPDARPATPDTLARMMQAVLDDLQVARAQLAMPGAVEPFDLTLQDIWFDVDSNGQRDKNEDVIQSLAAILLGRRTMREMGESGVLETPLTVRFDEADHAWLTAYTHMLSGFGNLFLAFDPSPVLQDLSDKRKALAQAPEISNSFDADALRAEIDALEAMRQEIEDKQKPARDRERELQKQVRDLRNVKPRDKAAIDLLNAQITRIRSEEIAPLRTQSRLLRAEIRAAQAKLGGQANSFASFTNDIDAIYVLLAALRQQPDAARVAATRDHWLEMIAQNRVFWAALKAETDNEREWIPNPTQTSALPLNVDADMARGWQAVLADAEAVLEGRLLLPHPLFPSDTGISLKAYAENPAPLDLINWIHGIAGYPYAAKGPMISRQRWLSFQRLTGGNAGGFALFFN